MAALTSSGMLRSATALWSGRFHSSKSLKSYEPVAHFTRHLVITDVRLGDWAADAAAGTTPLR